MSDSSTTVAILGGGLAGLQTSRLLGERGVESLVLESRSEPGGLCRSISSGPWRWDIGPHAFYSRRRDAMAYYEALPLDYEKHARRVRVAHRGPQERLFEVGYPFENGLADLPWKHRWDCLLGILRTRLSGRSSFENLSDWIENGLGDGIGRHFMLPYNRKIWNSELHRISMALVKGKIEPEPLWKVFRNAFVSGTVGRAYQSQFLYPKGGAGQIPGAVAAMVKDRLRLDWGVRSIRREDGRWIIESSDGRTVSSESVVSTIPIPKLVECLQETVPVSGEMFRYNDTYITAIGLKEGRSFGAFGNCHWTFFAGRENFYRLTFMDTMESGRLPVVVAETTKKSETLPPDALTAAVLRDLQEAGILDSEESVGLAQTHLEPNTYPIQTVGMEDNRARLETHLRSMGMHLIGRNGRWDYVNTDGIFLSVEAFVQERVEEMRA